MANDLLFQIALTMVPHIGDVNARALIEHFGTAESIFKAPLRELECIEGIGPVRASSLKSFATFKKAEEEIAFISKYNIKPLFITDRAFPQRLLNCYDAPVLLYYKGNADLNQSKIIAVVGTRHASNYGKQICEKLVEDLRGEDILIVSGLAFGIDTAAHKSALKNNIPTLGVLAHGLDRIYPDLNGKMAKEMLLNGGLLTNFRHGTVPDRQNFPSRNRIAAGISDCVIVVETGVKGGSIITAELGNSYSRDVFAFPGRVTDKKSEGCHYLIRSNKAALICNADDLLEYMSWKDEKPKPSVIQKAMITDLTPEEKTIIDILKDREEVHIDSLTFESRMSTSTLAQALLLLEMQGLIRSYPGKRYKIT